MKTVNLKKLLCIVTFVALAGFSCYWTAESLYIWQPSLTIAGSWLIAVAFFVIASLCFSMFVGAFNKNNYYGNRTGGRGGVMLMGLIGILVFWLAFSLPTNTHTLLYRASIKNVLTNDLERTLNYLTSFQSEVGNVEIQKIRNQYKAKEAEVEAILLRLATEATHQDRPGIAKRFNTIVLELNQCLGTKIPDSKIIGKTGSQIVATIQYYQAQAYSNLELIRNKAEAEIAEIKRHLNSKELSRLIQNTTIAKDDVNRMTGINEAIIDAATEDLAQGYAYIKANQKYINIKPEDVERYTKEGAIPEAQEMKSVPSVWKDYLSTDKYDGHGFLYWILIAILIDFAAFIFFNIAFKSENK